MGLNKLPLEVLLLIFKEYVDTDPFVAKHPRTSSHSSVGPYAFSPFQLMAVSDGWRSTVLAFAELWTNITIVDPNSESISLLKTYLQRSASLPLTLVISFQKAATAYCVQVMDLLREHAHRWQVVDFRFRISCSSQAEVLRSLTDLRFPTLTRATVALHPDVQSGAEEFVKRLYSGRSLKTITWFNTEDDQYEDETNPTINWSPSLPGPISRHFPWPRLHDISIYSIMDMRALFKGLCLTQHLTSLSLDWHKEKSNPMRIFSSNKEVVLPRVVTFKLRGIPHPCIFNILRRFTIPKLREFELIGVQTPSNRLNGSWNTSDILDFLRMSGCRLAKFSCRYTPTYDADNHPIRLLKSDYLVQLTHLMLDIPEVTGQLVDSLAVSGNAIARGETLMPELSYVMLRTCSSNEDVDAVLKMAQSRCEIAGPGAKGLDVLDFTSRVNVREEDRAVFNMLEEAGTIVKFTFNAAIVRGLA
ncbi:hypothetical protein BJ165DRAFT_376285 [Panaeolus papilionaceus]|nr:hypothetical protein BJ165DRAFT_376285 [Panaeolus papilionaceus]